MTEDICVQASRVVASTCNYVGIQDAARKWKFTNRKPGGWCDAKVESKSGNI